MVFILGSVELFNYSSLGQSLFVLPLSPKTAFGCGGWGLCWGARPSRLPFSASRRKPFPKLNGSTNGSGATPEPARGTRALPPCVRPRSAAFTPLHRTPNRRRRNFPTLSPIRTLKRAEARAPQRRPARHICSTQTEIYFSPGGGASSLRIPGDAAPERSLVRLRCRFYNDASPTDFAAAGTFTT